MREYCRVIEEVRSRRSVAKAWEEGEDTESGGLGEEGMSVCAAGRARERRSVGERWRERVLTGVRSSVQQVGNDGKGRLGRVCCWLCGAALALVLIAVYLHWSSTAGERATRTYLAGAHSSSRCKLVSNWMSLLGAQSQATQAAGRRNRPWWPWCPPQQQRIASRAAVAAAQAVGGHAHEGDEERRLCSLYPDTCKVTTAWRGFELQGAVPCPQPPAVWTGCSNSQNGLVCTGAG